jgi:hypothetical protein
MKAIRTHAPSESGISRRRLITRFSAAGGLLLGSAFAAPVFAYEENQTCRSDGACKAFPDPIPHVTPLPPNVGTFGKFHFFFPGPVEGTPAPTDPTGVHPGGRDPSTIYDFQGSIGQADLNLTGMGTDLNTGESRPYAFHTDMRFMDGVFLGTDARQHRGAVAFI